MKENKEQLQRIHNQYLAQKKKENSDNWRKAGIS